MTMQVNFKDYVILKENDSSLMYFMRADNKAGEYKFANAPHINSLTVSMPDESYSIVANFGQTFHVGKAYGLNLCTPLGRKETQLGDLWFFYKPDSAEDVQYIIDAINDIASDLIKMKLYDTYKDVVFELHTTKTAFVSSKVEAFYRRLRVGEKRANIIGIVADKVTPETVKHAIWHELFHHLFKSYKKIQTQYANWITYFSSYHRRVYTLEHAQQSLLKDYVSFEGTNKVFTDGLCDEPLSNSCNISQKDLFKHILKSIRSAYGISANELSILKTVDRLDLIETMWPSKAISLDEKISNGVTVYSLESIEECFCEIMAIYCCADRNLPVDATKLAKSTLDFITANIHYKKDE